MASAGAAADTAANDDLERAAERHGALLVPEPARLRTRHRARHDDSRLALRRAEDDRLALAVGRVGADAFELLYERFQQPLFGYCCAILGNREEAEDALQETMLRAYQALLNREGELRFKPWIYSIARNSCIDRIRQRKRLSDSEPTEELLEVVPSAEASSEQREEIRALLRDMTELSERQRSALVLREMSGFSHDEISDVLETSPGKCKSLISEARQALADRALGREMPCDELRGAVEANGRRVLHGRRLKAHVDTCHTCSDFVSRRRERALAAFAPLLPLLESRSLLARVLESGSAEVGGGGLVATLSLLSAKKLLVTAVVVTAVGAGASQLPSNLPAEKGSPAASRAGKHASAGTAGADRPSTKGSDATRARRPKAPVQAPATTGNAGTELATPAVPGTARPVANSPEAPATALGQPLADVTGTAGELTREVGAIPDKVRRVAAPPRRTIERAAGSLQQTTGRALDGAGDTGSRLVEALTPAH